MIWGGADVRIINIECTRNVICLNHPETIPYSPQLVEKLSSAKPVPTLMPKRLGTTPVEVSLTFLTYLNGSVQALDIWCINRLLKTQPHWKSWDAMMRRADSLEKTLMLGKIEGRRRRGRQDEMVGWHLWLNGHESEQTLRDSRGKARLACCSLWGGNKSDTTERLNSNNPQRSRTMRGREKSPPFLQRGVAEVSGT